MASLIVVKPPRVWRGGTKILEVHEAAVLEQAMKVKAACGAKSTRVLYSGYWVVRDIATEIHKALAHGDLLRVKRIHSVSQHTEMLWGFVNAVWDSGVEVVVLIDPVVEVIAERFYGTGEIFDFSPGQVVQIVKGGEVTKL